MTNDLCWEIPSTIVLEKLLKNHPPDFKYKIDHFYYIIDYLWNAMVYNDLDENAGFVNLNAATLQRANHNYKKYLEYLLNHRLLLTDMKYIVGKKSFGFLLNIVDSADIFVKRIPIKNWTIKRRMFKEIGEQNDSFIKTQKNYPFLSKWFNDYLEIDVEGAKKEALKQYPLLPSSGIRGDIKNKAPKRNKRLKAEYLINKLANRQFYYSIDENVGRFHSNLTNLKKEFRNYITYNGQKLVNVDIKNSQPLFSTLLFNKNFYNPKGLFNIFHIPFHSIILSNNIHSFSSTTIMIVKVLEKYGNQDIEKYLEIVNSGSFYKKISKLMYPNEAFNKEKVKPIIFTVLFSSNRYMGQPKAKAKRRFKEVLPYTYEIFRLLKLCDHTALSRILQRIESIIMIQNVVPRIAQERPDLPIFTIHDSVVTTVGNEDYVARVIIEEIKRITGLDAKVGKEYWTTTS
jgi:hypothetical protein